ncbi:MULTISPECIES: DsbA family protein [unclassified Cupriavidus]|uniref:DsbA family protein n=1 Tax=unclassified Cupriavidus TaxID=2640874 RepID=UPI00313E1B29
MTQELELIYIGDPMCSWCYGFGKEMTALQAKLGERYPGLPLRILVGGIRAGATDLLDDAGKRFRLQHWARVEQASGLPFNREAFLAREGFVYDTEPICRAVVAARGLVPDADLLAVFRALQRAFYVEGRDTTDGAVLAEAAVAALTAQGHDVTAEAFLAAWRSDAVMAETAQDFRTVRQWGVNSFPVVALRAGQNLYQVAAGYTPVEALVNQFERVVESARSSSAAA